MSDEFSDLAAKSSVQTNRRPRLDFRQIRANGGIISFDIAQAHSVVGRRVTRERNAVPRLPLICLVEDDDGMRTATARYIRSLGYEVRTFESAEAYLAEAKLERHCLVCDVQMPGMSGVELYEKLRGEMQAAPPTVFITAHSPDIVERRAWRETRILGKPFDGADLARCLEDVQPV